MVRTSIFEKLEILKNVIAEDSFLLIIFGFFLLLGILLYGFSKVEKKKYIKGFISIYALLILVLIIVYNVDLYKVIDYFINNVFYAILFPNLAIYSLMIIISNIILIKGLYNDRLLLFQKIVYVVFYTILSYFLFIVLRLIVDNGTDVYNISSVYLNTDLTAVLQVNMIIFIIWILFIIINKIFNKDDKITLEKNNMTAKEKTGIRKILVKIRKNKQIINNNINVNNDIKEVKKESSENKQQEEYVIPKFTKEEYVLLSNLLKKQLQNDDDNKE